MNLSSIADKARPDYWQRRIKKLEDEVAKLRTARSNAGASAADLISVQPYAYNLSTFTPSKASAYEVWDTHTLTIPASDTWTTLNISVWANLHAHANGNTGSAIQACVLDIQPGDNLITTTGTSESNDVTLSANERVMIPLTAAFSFQRSGGGQDSTVIITVQSFVDVPANIQALNGVVTLVPIYTR